MMDPLLTAKEVAAILKVHPNTVYQKAGKGDIPSVRTSSSRIRFKEGEIKEWIDKRSRNALPHAEQLPEFHLDLKDYDRIFLKGGKSAVKERTWRLVPRRCGLGRDGRPVRALTYDRKPLGIFTIFFHNRAFRKKLRLCR